jgi:O-methyltransferase involved in polyketide biosynthesis
LPSAGQDLLFERVADLSGAGSRMAVEAMTRNSFDPEYLERRHQHLQRIRGRTESNSDTRVPDTPNLWFIEERTDLTEWLATRGWVVTAIQSLDLMERYGRAPEGELAELAPRNVFIEGRLNTSSGPC